MKSPFGGREEGSVEAVRAGSPPRAPMTQGVSQIETGEVLLASFDLLEGTSASTRAKTRGDLPRALGSTGAQSQYAKRLSGGMALLFGILFSTSARVRKRRGLSRRGMVGPASGKQVDAEATLGGRPVALRFADDARGC
jgi:hypothetical protein